jgi:carboxypeptidase family protein
MFASRAVAISFILALSSLFSVAQTPPQPSVNPENSNPPKTGAITGQVVDENGQPLKDALVVIRAFRSSESQTASTDREGQFQIDGLEPLDYNISVSKPAYLSGRPEPRSRPYRVGDRVSFTLIKGGVITGKVTNANGDPVAMVSVRVEMVRPGEGQPHIGSNAQSRSTDDRGIYRIYGLPAGTYVVFAGGPDPTRRTSSESVFDFDVPTYAPSSTRETAAEINVRLGEEVTDVDIRYRAEQGRLITGDITAPGKNHAYFSVMLTAAGEANGLWGDTSYKSEDKRGFVFKGVADGEYTLVAQSSSPEGETAASEPKQITVQGADVTGIQLTTKLLGSVSGRVVAEELKLAECNNKDHPLSTETLVDASPRDDEAAKQIPRSIRSRAEPARPDEKGDFRLQNLTPGAYHFVPVLRARQWYVQSIVFAPPSAPTNAAPRTKQVDATRVWTSIKNGDRLSGLTITLAQGGATFRGEFVPAQGERVPEGLVLFLAPVEREQATDPLRFFATRINRNGYFELRNIAPGRYWVVAQMADEDPRAESPKVRLPQETEMRAQIRRAAEAAKTEIELKPCQDLSDFKLPVKPNN